MLLFWKTSVFQVLKDCGMKYRPTTTTEEKKGEEKSEEYTAKLISAILLILLFHREDYFWLLIQRQRRSVQQITFIKLLLIIFPYGLSFFISNGSVLNKALTMHKRTHMATLAIRGCIHRYMLQKASLAQPYVYTFYDI